MNITAKVKVNCNHCGTMEEIGLYNLNIYTITDIKNETKRILRENHNWKIRADGRAYCPECAKRMRLKGTTKTL